MRSRTMTTATLYQSIEAGKMGKMATSKKRQKQPNDPMYYVQFGYLLNRTGSLGAASTSDVLKAFNIPLPIWQILLILSEFGEQTISELASHTGIEMSYLSRTVLKAEKRGFEHVPGRLRTSASSTSIWKSEGAR